MTEIEFKWLTEPLAVLLTGKGVFIVSIVIAVIFGFIYYLKSAVKFSTTLK